MSGAYEIPGLRWSAETAGAVDRHRFLTLDANEKAITTVAGGRPVGVSMVDATAADQVMEIANGIVRVEAAGAIDAGTNVESDASGLAVAATGTAGYSVAGVAVTTAGAAGELVSVLV